MPRLQKQNSIPILIISAFLSLAVLHHAVNFWEMELLRQAFYFFLFLPVFFFALFQIFFRLYPWLFHITKTRWMFFLFPAFLISFSLAWNFHRAPSVWHTLQIVPAKGQGMVELREVKIPPGKVQKFEQIQSRNGWILDGEFFKTASADSSPLEFSFRAPIGQPASLLFLRSPASRAVTIILDGKSQQVELSSPEVSLYSFQSVTAYKMGIPASLILTLIALADFLMFFLIIFLLWLAQETSQHSEDKSKDIFLSHAANLTILLILALIFHAFNFFSVPLIVASDSASYLQGALHWMQFGNLDGVPAARGPGTTLLFLPAFLLAGNHPLGIKVILHLLSIGSVLLAYTLGWQIYQRRSFAFFSGLILLFVPEMYLYSNIVMSDVPNVFFVLAYCLTLLWALKEISWKSILTNMFLASFAILLRPENILLLAIGAGFLFLKIIWEKENRSIRLRMFSVGVFLAVLPLVYWSFHNQRVHGFFGLSNYADEVLYDGWVYYGEASNISITDHDSPAVKHIQQALDAYDQPLGETFVPTGWEIYPALLDYGYTEQQAIKLLGDAAKDSIRKDPALSWQIYQLKLRKSFVPPHSGVMEKTFIPIEQNGEIIAAQSYKASEYFESEEPIFFAFIPLQQKIYEAFPYFDRYIYRPLVFFCLAVALLALYQKDFFKWTPIILIALSRMFIPITIGIAHWHYMLAGIVILALFIFLGFQYMQRFFLAIKNPPDF